CLAPPARARLEPPRRGRGGCPPARGRRRARAPGGVRRSVAAGRRGGVDERHDRLRRLDRSPSAPPPARARPPPPPPRFVPRRRRPPHLGRHACAHDARAPGASRRGRDGAHRRPLLPLPPAPRAPPRPRVTPLLPPHPAS